MKLNKKGFTLIELIIAIVLMLSLTILVVVGFTKISDEKKKEADKLTEKQIETAAEQFFSSNYFYVNNLKKNKNKAIYVNIGKLVAEDYLNVTTKTSTEEKYDTCDIVLAKYGNSSLELSYFSNDDMQNYINILNNKDNFSAAKEAAKELGYEINNDEEAEALKNSLAPISEENVDGCMPTIGETTTPEPVQPEPDEPLPDEPEVVIVKDVTLKIKLDTEYIKDSNNKIKRAIIDDNHWYNKDIPVIVEVGANGNTENDAIKIVTLNNREISSDKLVSNKDDKFYKKYRFFVSNEGINNIHVKAENVGGKSSEATRTLYIDKSAPSINLALYKTNSSSIPSELPSISSMNSADYVSSNNWINASGKKNAYLIMETNESSNSDKVSGLDSKKTYCKPVSGYSSSNSSKNKLISSKKFKIVNLFKQNISTTYECQAFDKVGNSSDKITYIIKRDITAPVISIVGYKGNHNTIDGITNTTLNSVVKGLKKYSSDTWTKDSIVLTVSKGDNLSGIASGSCTDPRNNAGDFSGWRRVMNSSEGTFTFKCDATDKAGNKAVQSKFIVKRDITPPTIKSFTVQSVKVSDTSKVTTNYNNYLAKLKWNIEDKYTYLGKVTTNYKNKNDNKEWNRSSNKSKTWNFNGNGTYFKLDTSFNGKKKTVKLAACDILGNCTPDREVAYTITDFKCNIIKSTEGCISVADNKIEGRVTIKCNAPVRGNVKVTYTYGSKSTNAPGCNVKAVNDKYTLQGEQNMAVYNFRGCGGYYTLKYLRFDVAGKKIYESDDIWDSDSKSKDTNKKCDPKIGKYERY